MPGGGCYAFLTSYTAKFFGKTETKEKWTETMRQKWEAFSNWEELKDARKRKMLDPPHNRKTGDDDSCLPCGVEFYNVPEGEIDVKNQKRPNYRHKNNVSLFAGVAEIFLEPKSICRLCSAFFNSQSRGSTKGSREVHKILKDGDLEKMRERMSLARQRGEKRRQALL